MKYSIKLAKKVILVVLLLNFQMMFLASYTYAQVPTCNYDRDNPHIKHARQTFKSLNYNCAELEVKDLLEDKTIELQARADAHILLASIYYAKLRDTDEKEKKVVEQFVAAFRAFRNWRGDLDIKSTEFAMLMARAQDIVDTQPVAPEISLDSIAAPINEVFPGMDTKKKKPFYTKWWVIGLGVGVIGVAAMSGGGGDDPVDTRIPTMPPPPSGK